LYLARLAWPLKALEKEDVYNRRTKIPAVPAAVYTFLGKTSSSLTGTDQIESGQKQDVIPWAHQPARFTYIIPASCPSSRRTNPYLSPSLFRIPIFCSFHYLLEHQSLLSSQLSKTLIFALPNHPPPPLPPLSLPSPFPKQLSESQPIPTSPTPSKPCPTPPTSSKSVCKSSSAYSASCSPS
jgi:hypothetical protein